MSKDIDIKSLQTKLLAVFDKVRGYSVFIFIVVLLAIYGFLIFRVNGLMSLEPNVDTITRKLQTVKRPKIDQSAIDKIQQLKDNSVEVQTLFTHARNNPFQE